MNTTTQIVSEVFAELQNICGVSEVSLKSSRRKGMLSRYRSIFFHAVDCLTEISRTHIPLLINKSRTQKYHYHRLHSNEMRTSDEYREIYRELVSTLAERVK